MEDEKFGGHALFSEEEILMMFDAIRFEGQPGVTLNDVNMKLKHDIQIYFAMKM